MGRKLDPLRSGEIQDPKIELRYVSTIFSHTLWGSEALYLYFYVE